MDLDYYKEVYRNYCFSTLISPYHRQLLAEHFYESCRVRKIISDFACDLVYFLQNQQSYPFQEKHREILQEFFHALMKNTQKRSIVNYIRGNIKNVNTINEDVAVVAAKKLYDAGIFPLEGISNSKYTNDFYYGTITQALEHVSSYFNSSNSTSVRYEELKNCLDEYRKEFNLEELENIKEKFIEFINKAKDLNFNLNPKFIVGWKKRFKNKILEGKAPQWSYDKELFPLLIEYRKLFDNPERKDYIDIFAQEMFKEERLKNAKQVSKVNIPDIKLSPFKLRFGANHVKFKVYQKDADICISIDNHKVDGENILVTLIPHKKTKVWNFEQIDAINRKKEKIKKDAIKFQRIADKSTVTLLFNEISLKYNRSAIEQLGENEFLKGNISFNVDLIEKVDLKNLNQLSQGLCFFDTAINNSTSKTEVKLPTQFNAAFVDIGINPPFSIKFFKFNKNLTKGNFPVVKTTVKKRCVHTKFGFAKGGNTFQVEGNENKKLKLEIKEFENSIFAAKAFLRFIKNISKIENYKFILDHNSILDLSHIPFDIEKLDKEIAENVIQDKDRIEENIHFLLKYLTQDKLVELEKKFFKYFHNEVIPKFNKLRLRRAIGFSDNHYNYLFAVKNFISLKKSVSYSKQPPLDKNHKRDPNAFKYLMAYYRNLCKETLNLSAAVLRNVLVENDVNVCVFEDLKNFRTSAENSRSMNRLLSVWSHQKIFQKYKETLEKVGIVIKCIDSRHSSQFDVETLNWGGREKPIKLKDGKWLGDKTKLWVIRDKKRTHINSDLSACNFLAWRFFTRHQHVIYLKTIKVGDKYLILLPKNHDEKQGRLSCYLHNKIGSKYALVKNGELVKVSSDEYCKLKEHKESGVYEFYLHGEKWLDKESHKKEQEKLIHGII